MNICLKNIPINKVINLNIENAILSNKTIVFREMWSPPYVFFNMENICGPLIKIIVELAMRNNYKYIKSYKFFKIILIYISLIDCVQQ